ncbi:MAG TPA: tRNA uridine-5-carboxymethylaminomethyl(34) synthesis enzyme MnmG, partial [Acidiferrobacteraceae bacterium]|nr:tRNA uridine-5-carboxymethylaminomethyl(34) synthesis enzyme MnmG [Acidiferrobacteraceae bacterium]HEX19230.1 tRNA uridine-5-carboxymethylaminomethyl(34) synthesis enzyme MnmG [Acidiferrobacteraceae bacterium]
LERTCLRPGDVSTELAQKILGQPLSREYKLVDLLRRPEVSYDDLQQLDPTPVDVDPEVAQQVEVQTKYAGYIVRQQEEIDRHRRFEDTVLPEGIDYDKVYGLSNEIRQKLNDHRPVTLGQAARISGVTPAAISLLLVHLKRRA